ncbi:MAG: tetratricopeptide repeat protein [Promethearchaeota archaeon]
MPINCIVLTHDERYLISGDSAGYLQFWDFKKLELNNEICVSSTEEISGIEIIENDNSLLVATKSGNLSVWSIENRKKIRELKKNYGSLSAIALSPNNKHIVVANLNGDVTTWEFNTEEHLSTIIGQKIGLNRRIAFSKMGNSIISCGEDNTVKEWDIQTGELMLIIGEHTDIVTHAEFLSPEEVISMSGAGTIKIWDSDTGQYKDTLINISNPISLFRVSRDKKFIAIYDEGSKVWLLEYPSRKVIMTLNLGSTVVNDILISPSNKFLISGSNDSKITIWSIEKDIESNSLETQGESETKELKDGIDEADVYFRLMGDGGMFSIQNQHEKAVKAYEAALKCKPKLDNSALGFHYYVLAGALFRVGRYEESEEYITKAVELYPQEADAWSLLGEHHLRHKRIPEAIEVCEKATTLKPELYHAWLQLSGLYRQMQDFSKAIHAIKMITVYNHFKNSYIKELQELAFEAGLKEENEVAEEAYILLTNVSNLFYHWHSLGVLYFNQKRYDEAIKCMRKVQEIEPNEWPSYHVLSKIYKEMGKLNEAIMALEAVIFRYPDYHDALYELGNFYSSDQPQKAISIWKSYLNVKPDASQRKEIEGFISKYSGLFFKGEILSKLISDKECVELPLSNFTGHTGEINSISFSHNGKYIVTGGEDGSTRLWNFETGDLMLVLTEHKHNVRSVVFSHNDRYIISGSYNLIVIWDLTTGSIVNRIKNEEIGSIYSLSLSPTNNEIFAGCSDGNARVWNFHSGRLLKTIKCLTVTAFTPDGLCVIAGNLNSPAIIWNLRTGEQIGVLNREGGRIHNYAASSIAISADSHHVVTGSPDGVTRVWDLRTGELEKFLKKRDLVSQIVTYEVKDVAISSNGDHVFSGSVQGITYWQRDKATHISPEESPVADCIAISKDAKYIATGTNNALTVYQVTHNPPNIVLVKTFGETTNKKVDSFEVSPNFEHLVLGTVSNEIQSINIRNGKLRTLEKSPREIGRVSGATTTVTISPDSKQVIAGVALSNDHAIRIFDIGTGELIRKLLGHKSSISFILIHSSSEYMLTGSMDDTIKKWDLRTGEEINTMTGHSDKITCLSLSQDENTIISGSMDRTIKFWDFYSGEILRTFREPTKFVIGAMLSSKNSLIVSVSDDNIIRLVSSETGSMKKEISINISTLKQRRREIVRYNKQGNLELRYWSTIDLAFSRDHKFVALYSPTEILVWNMDDEEIMLNRKEIRQIDFETEIPLLKEVHIFPEAENIVISILKSSSEVPESIKSLINELMRRKKQNFWLSLTNGVFANSHYCKTDVIEGYFSQLKIF